MMETMSQVKHYEMKDSGVEWIGKIPKDWDIVRFKRMHRGSNVGLSLDKDYWSTNEDDTVFYTAGLKSIHTSYKNIEPEMLTKENDLLLARNGTPYVYFPCVGAIYTDHIIRVGIENGYNKSFIRYCLQQSIANEVVDTVSIATWSVPIWNRQCLPHPPLPEQAAIAAYLDEKCATIDAIVSEAKATIEEYKTWKSSVIFEAVTKGLDPNAEMKDSGVEWIGEMPDGWEVVKLKFITDCLDGHRIPVDASLRVKGPYPYWGAGAIMDYVDKYIFDDELVLLGEDGAPFFDLTRDVAHLVHGKIWVNNHIHVLKTRDMVNANYLTHYLNIVNFHSYINGSILNKLTQGNMNKIVVTLPPLPEQTAIAAYLDEKCAAIDGVIAEKEALITELETYKKSLIFETVTGKRRVR
jgi:type I restriction enzyme S subunit